MPTGAGGFWSQFILTTEQLDLAPIVQTVPATDAVLTPLHPALHVLQVAWGPVESMSFMVCTGRRPLPDHEPKDLYVPVGKDDSFYPIELFDALAVAYGNPRAGEIVWPSMQESLDRADLGGVVDYPLEDNLQADSGPPYTEAIVQYEGDGRTDPHAMFVQREGAVPVRLLLRDRGVRPGPHPGPGPARKPLRLVL